MNNAFIIILSILGISVLLSYYIVLRPWQKDDTINYFNHPFWYGINSNIVKMLSIFQIFAVIGFLVGILYWIKTPPQTGIMSNNYILFTVLSVFLISAIFWPFATYYKIKWLVVLSLIITAICSILMLAGSIEDINAKWYIVLSFIFLCITTVLGDAVLWNANYIKKNNLFKI
jgi:hypothetical protein